MAALPILLIGCGQSSPDWVPAITPVTPVTIPAPCLDLACATKTEHLSIFDAENSVFSSDGRLFISGGEDIYEITKGSDTALQSTQVSSEACNYTGLEIVASTLYAACGDNRIFASDLGNISPTVIYTVNDAQLTNGLTELNGFLYVTDGPISLSSKIIQLEIASDNPLSILGQENWTTAGELTSANGLQTVNGELWVTDYNALKRYEVGSDGSKGASSTIFTNGTGAYDDFTVLDTGQIVMNDFVGNASQLFSADGTLLESSSDVLGPSSAIQGEPPMFDRSQIIITEKGTLGDNTEGNGNRLAVFTAAE